MQGVVARRNNFAEPILAFLEAAYAQFAELTGAATASSRSTKQKTQKQSSSPRLSR